MNIDNSALKPFIGGLWYFRIVCFEPGPDLYYIFRSRIVDLSIREDGSFVIDRTDIYPNRLVGGAWIKHPIDQGVVTYDRPIRMTLLSPTKLSVKFDHVADAMAYVKDEKPPSDLDLVMNFPKGYEAIAIPLAPLRGAAAHRAS